MYLLKLSLRPWRRSPFSQVFTAVAVGVLLFLAGFLFWMQRGMSPVIDRLQNEQVITAYLDPSLNANNEGIVVDQIRTTVGAHPQPDVELVRADQFISHLRGDYPELAKELEDLGSEMQMIIPRYVSVSGILSPAALGEIRGVKGVQSAESSTDRFQNVIGAFRALKWIAALLTLGLGLALTTGLIHLGRTNAFLHQDTSALMRLMGASSGALRAPGLVSGALVGLLGGALASAMWASLGVSLAGHVRSLSPMLRYMPESQAGFAVGLLITGIILGAVSGILGNVLGIQSSRAHGRG